MTMLHSWHSDSIINISFPLTVGCKETKSKMKENIVKN